MLASVERSDCPLNGTSQGGEGRWRSGGPSLQLQPPIKQVTRYHALYIIYGVLQVLFWVLGKWHHLVVGEEVLQSGVPHPQRLRACISMALPRQRSEVQPT